MVHEPVRSLTRRTAAIALLVFAGCYGGAALGTRLRFPEVGTAILFLPYAVLVVALVRTPARAWWLMIAAAALGNAWPHYDGERSVSFVALAEVANATRALLVAGGLRLLAKGSRLGTLRDMALFMAFAGAAGPAVGAFLGAAGATLNNRPADYWAVWEAWALSNSLTGLTILPIALTAGPAGHSTGYRRLRRLVEPAALLLGLLIVGILVLSGSRSSAGPPAYLLTPLPFLLWAAVRLGPGGTSLALATMTVTAIHGALRGLGPFATLSPADSLLQLQFFLIGVSVPTLLLAAVVEQNAHAAAELQRSEARYRSVVEDQTELICRFLADGTYNFVNGAYCRYFGCEADQLLGKSFWMFLPESEHRSAREFLDSITIEHPVATREHEVIGPAGEIRWQHWTDRGLFDSSGRLVEYQAVGRDVTDRRRAEAEHRLLESQKRVEEALRETDRRKDEFLAMLAHELRNPLAPITVAVELMRQPGVSGRQSALAQATIARQVGHITRLVDDLLDVSRITLGKIALKMETVRLAAVVAQAVETTDTIIRQRDQALMVSLQDPELRVRGDSVRLGQVVANLLHNAAKYTQPGGRIELTAARAGADVVLGVRDNGSGIAPDMLERVFDLFAQGQHTFVAAEQGLGIGLTLVKRLVAMHGGVVEAHSGGANQGSEFIVRLPALEDMTPLDQPVAPRPAPASAPLRILVVDDNVDAADSLAQLLALWGHSVQVAHDGEAAIESEHAFAPDAVLLDLGLPRIDGFEVARRLRQRRFHDSLLLVAITGFGRDIDRVRSAEAGIDRHFTKPVDYGALESVIGDWAAARNRPPVGS